MEYYLSHQDALRFIDECERRGARILGMEFMDVGDDYVVPLNGTAWDALDSEPPAASWREARAVLRDGIPDGGNAVVIVAAE